MSESINGDLSVRVTADTARMEWTASPSPSVQRKRVHLVGPAEAGQVTSVVRYAPHSRFHAHDHPDGEEILVLEGVFSDEHGDWPEGTFLLNPEGFHHAPFSTPGRVLFVKLRQFAGRGRRHVVVHMRRAPWSPTAEPGVERQELYRQSGFADCMDLERWRPGTDRGVVEYEQGAELFVLDGAFADEAGRYAARSWLRFPVGSRHRPRTDEGCTIYVKRSGLRYLASDAK